MRRGEKGGARAALRDGVNRKRPERSFAHAAKLREKPGEAVVAVGVAHVEDGIGYCGMAQKDPRQLKTGISGDTYDGDLIGLAHFSRRVREAA